MEGGDRRKRAFRPRSGRTDPVVGVEERFAVGHAGTGVGLSRSMAPQDVGEQVARDGDFGHLEDDIAAATDDLRADLDQILTQRSQRPLPDGIGQRQSAHEVAEIVGQRVELEPDGVVIEPAAGQARPADRVLALLDVLLGRAALIMERDYRQIPQAPNFF